MTHSHKFKGEEIKILRRQLLAFYDTKKRDLPWRRLVRTFVLFFYPGNDLKIKDQNLKTERSH